MKGSFFFTLASLLLVLFVYMVATRDRVPHLMPGADGGAAVAAAGDASADAGIREGGAVEAAVATKPEAPVPSLGRPLRVAVLGWEHVSPAFAPRADAGPAQLGAQPVEVAVEASLGAIESRLAKGGADAQGADLGVLPLPSFVASFERLRALDPRVFLVQGWSVGREELRGAKDATLARAPDGEVKLAVVGNDSATLLALFALDRAGTPPSRVKLLTPGAPDVKAAPWAAAGRGDAIDGDRRLVLNTAEARRLVPIVAVAGAGALDAQGGLYKVWSQAWLEGIARARADAPGAARQIAAMQGAPDALAVLERWGQLDAARAVDAAALLAAKGGVAVTIESLFTRGWTLFRGVGLLSSPAPEKAPVWPAIAESLVAGAPPVPPGADAADAGAARPAAGATLLLVHREPESADPAAVAAEAAFLAEVFDRATLRVGAKNEKSAKAALDAVQERAPGVAPRVVAAPAAAPAGYVVEVLAP